jgi:hypothetical protein
MPELQERQRLLKPIHRLGSWVSVICTRLSRALSTTSESDFALQRLPFSGINPIVRHTRSALMPIKTTVDLPGPVMLPSPNVPCSLTQPQSPATSPFAVCLLVPASHYDAVGLRLSI